MKTYRRIKAEADSMKITLNRCEVEYDASTFYIYVHDTRNTIELRCSTINMQNCGYSDYYSIITANGNNVEIYADR